MATQPRGSLATGPCATPPPAKIAWATRGRAVGAVARQDFRWYWDAADAARGVRHGHGSRRTGNATRSRPSAGRVTSLPERQRRAAAAAVTAPAPPPCARGWRRTRGRAPAAAARWRTPGRLRGRRPPGARGSRRRRHRRPRGKSTAAWQLGGGVIYPNLATTFRGGAGYKKISMAM